MKKLLALLPTLLLIASCGTTTQESQKQEQSSEEDIDLTPSIFNENMIHYQGRTNKTDKGVTFAMTCSGFEVKVNVTDTNNSLKATLYSYADQGGPSQFAYVFVDGEEPSEKLALAHASTLTPTLTESLPLGEHYIRFVKLNEGTFTYITLKDLEFQGMEWVRWDKKYEKRIEFLGDSITCGYGSDGTTPDPFSLEGENGVHTYGYTCATDLDYDYSFCSQSGISLCMNAWNNDYYFEDLYHTYDSIHEFDLTSWPVDIAVIALGTNDNTKFNTLSPTEQATRIEDIFTKYKELSDWIKENNPDCQIFFAYNLMLTQNGYIDTAIKGTCIYLNDKYGYGTAYRYECQPDSRGSGGHPGKDAQIRDGHLLAEFIKDPYDIDE